MTSTTPNTNTNGYSVNKQLPIQENRLTQVNGQNVIVPPPPPRQPNLKLEPKASNLRQKTTLPPSGKPPTSKQAKPDKKIVRRWWQQLSLGSKTTIVAIILGTLPVVAIGGLSFYIASRGNLEELANGETTRTVSLQSELNQFLTNRLADIENIAQLPVFIDPVLRDQLTPQQKSNALDRFMANHKNVYSSIAFFDLQGKPIAQTSAGKRLGNHLDRTYIQAAIEVNGPIISQPSISTTSGEFSIYTASVVKDPVTNTPIGYVRARIPVTALESFLQSYSSESSKYYLANQDDEIFLGSDGAHILQTNSAGQENNTNMQVLNIQDVFPDMAPYFDIGQPDAQKALNTLSNETEIVAFAPSQPLEGAPNPEWTAVITQDLSTLLIPQRRLLIAIGLGTVVSAILATSLAIVLSRRLVTPLLAATKAVDQIGQGNLDTRLTVEGEDEIAQLGNNINAMADQLKQFTREQQFAAQQARLLASITAIEEDLASENGQIALTEIFSEVRAFLHTDRIVLYRLKQGRKGKRAGYISHESVGEGLLSAMEVELNDPCIPADILSKYEDGRTYVVDHVHEATMSDEHRELLQRLNVKSLLVVPIVNQNRLFGLLITHKCIKGSEWSQNNIDMLQQFGQQLGVLLTVQDFASLADEQKKLKEGLQKRALALMMEIDPVSKGDLTVRAKVTEDEIGTVADSYNATISNLRKIVTEVQTAATQMSSTVVDNQPLVEVLSSGAEQQTTEISEALQQIQQMVESIRAVAASTEEAEQVVRRATATVADSDAAMNKTVTGIGTIRETVAETAKKVKRLGEASQKISGVINLISEFAEQTNLLALNASIEAARAGEEGRGFAVVAEEVRSLARQSAEATLEIENLVASIQAETNEVVTAMEVGTEQVVEGTQLVDETRNSLNKIEVVAAELNTLIESIAQATQLQAQSSESVTTVIQGVAGIAERTSSEASQVSHSFQTLLAVAEALQASVSQFKVS